MKISKFVQTIKTTSQCIVIHTPEGLYLSSGCSIYKAAEIPDVKGRAQIAAILDMEPKKFNKIHVDEIYSEGRRDIEGYDFSEDPDMETDMDKMDVAAVYGGEIYTALRSKHGEILFFDERLLAPIHDRIKDEGAYLSFAVREHPNGHKYIVVKDGFEVLAVLLPVEILSEQYMTRLDHFYRQCKAQYESGIYFQEREEQEGQGTAQQEDTEDDEQPKIQ